MRRKIKWGSITFTAIGTVAVLAAGVGVVVAFGTRNAMPRSAFGKTNDPRLAVPGRPVTSPSGRYVLSVRLVKVEKLPYYAFDVATADKTETWPEDELFSARHTTFFCWDDDERVWVYSGDVGTYVWERAEDGSTWIKKSRADSGLQAPAVLKKLRPKLH